MIITNELKDELLNQIKAHEDQIKDKEELYNSLMKKLEDMREEGRQIREQCNDLYREIYPIQQKIKSLQNIISE
jgi:peptidoglycan hydrolase CwlO-like protein